MMKDLFSKTNSQLISILEVISERYYLNYIKGDDFDLVLKILCQFAIRGLLQILKHSRNSMKGYVNYLPCRYNCRMRIAVISEYSIDRMTVELSYGINCEFLYDCLIKHNIRLTLCNRFKITKFRIADENILRMKLNEGSRTLDKIIDDMRKVGYDTKIFTLKIYYPAIDISIKAIKKLFKYMNEFDMVIISFTESIITAINDLIDYYHSYGNVTMLESLHKSMLYFGLNDIADRIKNIFYSPKPALIKSY